MTFIHVEIVHMVSIDITSVIFTLNGKVVKNHPSINDGRWPKDGGTLIYVV